MIRYLPEKVVTFIENHDIGSTQKLWPFPFDKVMQGYAYILTQPGIPSIFYDHFLDYKKEIKSLTGIRKRNNIGSNSKCIVIVIDGDLYMATIDEKIVMKIGPIYELGMLTPSVDFQVAASDNDYWMWEKKALY
eukprot:Gb_22853 [translate_table: standard]